MRADAAAVIPVDMVGRLRKDLERFPNGFFLANKYCKWSPECPADRVSSRLDRQCLPLASHSLL
jgi:hypothetical protein